MRPPNPSRNGSDLGGEHFGKFVKEPYSAKRACLSYSDAFRQKCVRAFASLRISRNKLNNKARLKRPHVDPSGVEYERWSLEKVLEMTADYMRRKEDAKFENAFAKLGE